MGSWMGSKAGKLSVFFSAIILKSKFLFKNIIFEYHPFGKKLLFKKENVNEITQKAI